MSIQSEIIRIDNNIKAALEKIANKGVIVPENANSDTLPALIELISGSENLDAVLTEQESLIEELKALLQSKAGTTGSSAPALIRRGMGSIDTGVDGANSNLKIEARYEFLAVPTAYFNIIYAYSSENANSTRIIYNKDSYVYCCLNSKTSDSLSSGLKRYPNVVYTDILKSENSTTFSYTQNGVKATKARTSGTALEGRNIYIFTNSSSNDGVEIKLYYLKIYDGDTLVRHFVPHTTKDGERGLYDLVGHRFYGNFGKGTFEIEGGNSNLPGDTDADTMVGLWEFKEELELDSFDFYFNFTLPRLGNRLLTNLFTDIGDGYANLLCADDEVENTMYDVNGWVGEEYRLMHLVEEPEDAEAKAWVKANARKLTYDECYEDGYAEGEKAILSTYVDWSVSSTSSICIVNFNSDCDYYARIYVYVGDPNPLTDFSYEEEFVLEPYGSYCIDTEEVIGTSMLSGQWDVTVVIQGFSKDGEF